MGIWDVHGTMDEQIEFWKTAGDGKQGREAGWAGRRMCTVAATVAGVAGIKVRVLCDSGSLSLACSGQNKRYVG